MKCIILHAGPLMKQGDGVVHRVVLRACLNAQGRPIKFVIHDQNVAGKVVSFDSGDYYSVWEGASPDAHYRQALTKFQERCGERYKDATVADFTGPEVLAALGLLGLTDE